MFRRNNLGLWRTMISRNTPYVFISYSHDDSSFAASLSARLHRTNIPHFRDIQAIEWGEHIPHRIHAALERATHLIILVSPGSERSQWVSYETGYARGRGVILVPYLLHPRMTVPSFLANIRYLHSRSDEAKFLKSLQTTIRRIQNSKKRSAKSQIDNSQEPKSEVKEALAKIRSMHPQIRKDGVDVLVQHKAESTLLELIGHRDANVRSSAALALAMLKSKKALRYLIIGLGHTGKTVRNPIIPDVENFLAHYDEHAFGLLLQEFPKKGDSNTEGYHWYREKYRWITALANTVDESTARQLLQRTIETGVDCYLEAALQSGLNLRKRDLEPAIHACLRSEERNHFVHSIISEWLSSSPNGALQWSRRLVRKWVESDVAIYSSSDKFWSSTMRLVESALLMGSIFPEEILVLTEPIANRELSNALNKLATKWKDK